MPAVSISTDALDYFREILTVLCRDTLAVTVVRQGGEPFGAVLASRMPMGSYTESWDEAAGRRAAA